MLVAFPIYWRRIQRGFYSPSHNSSVSAHLRHLPSCLDDFNCSLALKFPKYPLVLSIPSTLHSITGSTGVAYPKLAAFFNSFLWKKQVHGEVYVQILHAWTPSIDGCMPMGCPYPSLLECRCYIVVPKIQHHAPTACRVALKDQ